MMLTGMRRTSACEARVEHPNVKAAVLHVPNPKSTSDANDSVRRFQSVDRLDDYPAVGNDFFRVVA
jgi:hypothetical protein